MSIADKLVTIAENQSKVYDAGKVAVLRDSKYMNATVSGEVIAVKDVSPIESEVEVRLLNDTLTDFSSVTVKRHGKNLLPFPYVHSTRTTNGITFTVNDDGSVTMNGTATGVSTHNLVGKGVGVNASTLPEAFVLGEMYVFSAGTVLPIGVSIGNYFYNEEGTALSGASGGAHINEGKSYNTHTVNVENERLYSHIRVSAGTVLENFTIYPMIEKGKTMTAYEPYTMVEYTPNADGTLVLPNLSPCMTLATDTDGVTLNCSYLRDIDAYIDGLGGV